MRRRLVCLMQEEFAAALRSDNAATTNNSTGNNGGAGSDDVDVHAPLAHDKPSLTLGSVQFAGRLVTSLRHFVARGQLEAAVTRANTLLSSSGAAAGQGSGTPASATPYTELSALGFKLRVIDVVSSQHRVVHPVRIGLVGVASHDGGEVHTTALVLGSRVQVKTNMGVVTCDSVEEIAQCVVHHRKRFSMLTAT